MNSLNQKRGNAKGRLTRAAAFIDSIDETTSVQLLEIRLQSLESTWKDFSSLHNELIQDAVASEFEEFEQEFEEYENRYFYAHSSLKKAIHERQPSSNMVSDSIVDRLANQQSSFLENLNSTPKNSSSVNLPPITIPPFSGDYKDWPSFRDLFTGSVDNKTNLNATQKFHYLKSFLRDEAANLVKHIPISESNYVEAWERLEHRYDRVHLITQSYIQTFLSLPLVTENNVQSLRKLTDGADEVVRGLNAIEQNSRDPWLIYLLVNKLNNETKQAWAEHAGSRDKCAFSELLTFLQSRCDALESCQSLGRVVVSRSKPQGQIRAHVAEAPETKLACPKCAREHILPQCPEFIALDIGSRRNLVKRKSLCFNCLRIGHSSNKCRSSFRCRVCKSRHHSLVHPSEAEGSPATSTLNKDSGGPLSSSNPSNSAAVYPSSTLINNHSLKLGLRKQTILPTLLAKVKDNQGKFVNCRVLLDSGSQVSFIGESFAHRLGLKRNHAHIPILGLSSTEAGYTRGCMSLQIYSRFHTTCLQVDAFILRKLTSLLPSQRFENSSWSHIINLELADPQFNVPGPVDILIGADKLWNILEGEQIRGPPGTPIAQKTSFGWVITGEILDPHPTRNTLLSSFHSVLDIDILLQRFWELEEVATSQNTSCINDKSELHFRNTFTRSSDGKYIVQLPFADSTPTFKDTLRPAVSRLLSMERRFRSNPELQQAYSKFMQEYLSLGHMESIPPEELDKSDGKLFYLPHHAVLKPSSSSTKLRVVFDGSAKDSKGQSLNSTMLIGPPIQRDLHKVCLRFRQHRYVFSADIVKMFRQIWIDDKHTDYQRIVWRESVSDEIQHFRLRTVTYGTASAPFLSVRVLSQLAEDYKLQYPIASSVLLNDVYVDDIMTGSNSVEDLISLQREIIELLSKGKFQLRKWTSNCWPLLAQLPKEDCEFCWVDPEESRTWIKVLGMYWSPTKDEFSYKLGELPHLSTPTRRNLLSEIARIFDPLGFLAPSVILFKILFQQLWLSKPRLSWDDALPTTIADQWMDYREQISCFENIRVPRNIVSGELDGIELHGFSDASSMAIAAVIYARYMTPAGNFKTTIVAAKTKVTPLKPVTIPRLELCGALLLSRLLTLVKSSLSTNISKVYAWCDSEIVLHWLSSPPRRWSTFVANRTAVILETIPRQSWNHIASTSNPADCASRGVLPSQLANHELWWNGPPWLASFESQWPRSTFVSPVSVINLELPEERNPHKVNFVSTFETNTLQGLIEKVSSWNRLQRIVAYCLRFSSNCRSDKLNRRFNGLSLSEIQKARTLILKHVQHRSFKEDIGNLASGKHLPIKSRLAKVSPFIDHEGILRVGGRLKASTIAFNIKHPVILPSKDNVSSIIVRDIHIKHLHTGISETFVIVRQQYWILGSRNLIRRIVHSCKPCFMQRRQTSSQLMGNLPMSRIQPSRPFSNVGCDYAGPVNIKFSRGRKPLLSKAYIALFICMSTKAIHLEVVSDLTTNAFLAALRRFVSRRGKCSNIYSDNGSNFQGARRCLNDMQKTVISQTWNEEIATSLANDGITWHFIPPSAPHFGGLWEAGVRSVKLHLLRVVGSSILTFEELCTVLTQIEAVLNSRPLCALSDYDLNPLTPSHFLIGEPLTAVPEPNLLNTPTNRLTHWNYLQSMVQGFWKRWQMEYITSLQERPKWQQVKEDFKPGDLVVVKEPNLPPTKWILGRIEAVARGSDNYVRVATVRTSGGSFVRPITKLALLPCC